MLHNLYGIHRQKPLHKVLPGFKGTGTNPKEINTKLRDTRSNNLGAISGLPEALRTQRSLNNCLRKKAKKKPRPPPKPTTNDLYFKCDSLLHGKSSKPKQELTNNIK